MNKIITSIAILTLSLTASSCIHAKRPNESKFQPAQPEVMNEPPSIQEATLPMEYLVGIEDMMDISILQPEKLLVTVTVAPDGSITFPYIGSVKVKDMTLAKIQNEIQTRLANGFMKYPLVSVSLKESRSKKFFVYGEVIRPGTYMLEDNTTVLKAISTAGGFTKFGSSSRVKVLRPNKNKPGYEVIKVNINAVMNGSSDADILIQPQDIITVSRGVF